MITFSRPLPSLIAATLLSAHLSTASWAESADHAWSSGETAQTAAEQAAQRNAIRVAQGYNRPPGEIGEGAGTPYPGEEMQGAQQDPASLLVRIGRLETQVRQLNGQIEQMQFETRRLEEQLRKFQEDIDFRFREGAPASPAASPPQKRSESTETKITANAAGTQQGAAPFVPARRGDAFDPEQNPAAPGAPRPLGSLAPATAAGAVQGRHGVDGYPGLSQTDPGAPLDLSGGRSRAAGVPAPAPPLASVSRGGSTQGGTAPGGTAVAALPNSPRQEFDVALAYLKQRSYENAEKGFSQFLEKNPKDKMASDAHYFLGESFYLRGRHREAAEQYLKVSAQYPSSPRAPEALLRLGQSLNALHAKEQACATFSEIPRKYPNAPSMVKVGAEREAKRAQC